MTDPAAFRTPAPPPVRPIRIRDGGLDDPRVVELLRLHVTRARTVTPPGSSHALDVQALRTPDIRFFSAWLDERPIGTGALRRLDAAHGEVKSMYTDEAVRGRGAARALLGRIEAAARAWGLARLSLETGSFAYFAPARALYAACGYTACPPFGGYREDPNSVFMTRTLDAPGC